MSRNREQHQQPHTPGDGRIELLVGGSKQAHVSHNCVEHVDLVVYFDVPREIQNRRRREHIAPCADPASWPGEKPSLLC